MQQQETPELIDPDWIAELDSFLPTEPYSAETVLSTAVEHLSRKEWVRLENEKVTTFHSELTTGYLIIQRESTETGARFDGRVIIQNYGEFDTEMAEMIEPSSLGPRVWTTSPTTAQELFCRLEEEAILREKLLNTMRELIDTSLWSKTEEQNENLHPRESVCTYMTCHAGITISATFSTTEDPNDLGKFEVLCSFEPEEEPRRLTGEYAQEIFNEIDTMYIEEDLLRNNSNDFNPMDWVRYEMDQRIYFVQEPPISEDGDVHIGFGLTQDGDLEVVYCMNTHLTHYFKADSLKDSFKTLETHFKSHIESTTGRIIEGIKYTLQDNTGFTFRSFLIKDLQIEEFTFPDTNSPFRLGKATNPEGGYSYYVRYAPLIDEPLEDFRYSRDIIDTKGYFQPAPCVADTVEHLLSIKQETSD